MNGNERDYSDLVHEVYSRGSSIQEAADLIQKASPEERLEMLRLMKEQALSLAEFISKFASGRLPREAAKP